MCGLPSSSMTVVVILAILFTGIALSISMPPTIVTSQDWIDNWKFELGHDFEQNGLPAQWASGLSGPKRWGEEDHKLTFSEPPTALAISTDATMIAVAVGTEILIHDTRTFGLCMKLYGHAGNIGLLAFQPNGKILVSSSTFMSSSWRRSSLVRLHDLNAAGVKHDWEAFMVPMLGHSKEELVSHRSWLAEDVDAMQSNLRKDILETFLRLEAKRDIHRGDAFQGSLTGFGSKYFTHDGRFFFYAVERPDAEIVVYNIAEKREQYRLAGHGDAIMWVGSNPNDTVLATTSWDSTVKIWRVDDGKLIHTLKAEGQLWAGAFSPNGDLFAVGSGSGKIFVWKVESAELVMTLDGGKKWVRGLAFKKDSRSGDLYLAAGGRGLRIFNIKTGECTHNWEVDQGKGSAFYEVSDVQSSPDGFMPQVIGAGASDGRLVLYDIEQNTKWEFEQPMEGAPLYYGRGSYVFNKANSSVISADPDDALRIWKL